MFVFKLIAIILILAAFIAYQERFDIVIGMFLLYILIYSFWILSGVYQVAVFTHLVLSLTWLIFPLIVLWIFYKK